MLQRVALQDAGLLVGNGGVMQAVVVHHVAAVHDATTGVKSLMEQVVDSRLGGCEEYGRELVAHDAVDLLGHGHVEGTEPCLYVIDRHVQLAGCHGAGQRAVGVAIEDQPVELARHEHLLDAGNHLGCLLAMSAGADGKIVFGKGYLQFIEEHLRHILVVVLSGVEDMFLYAVGEMRPDSPGKGGSLDDLRTCADNGEDMEHDVLVEGGGLMVEGVIY